LYVSDISSFDGYEVISDDSQEQTTGLERVLTDAEEKAKMLEIV